MKKRVSWAEDTNLVSVHYFELDESERGMYLIQNQTLWRLLRQFSRPCIALFRSPTVNVNRPKSFLDAAQREKMREREARESGLMFSRDRLIEMIPVSPMYRFTFKW